MTIKVLIIDDSAVIRKSLTKELSKAADIEVVGAAPDPYIGRDMIVEKKPDVVTLDIEMPRMDGLTFLKKLMKAKPMPVIVLSSIATKGSDAALEATRLGAIEVLAKPSHAYSAGEVGKLLIDKIRSAKQANLTLHLKQVEAASKVATPVKLTRPTSKVIVVGSSTGGTTALETLLRSFPSNAPATVITQHMPPGFTKSFADRLNQICQIEVKEAANGDEIKNGRALIAPGGYHMLIKKSGHRVIAEVKDGAAVGNHKPSVDVLFHSAARELRSNAVGIILTGMGGDGAEGMKAMRDAGAYNVAQDEATCVVYGMPKVAVEKGGVNKVLPLGEIAGHVLN